MTPEERATELVRIKPTSDGRFAVEMETELPDGCRGYYLIESGLQCGPAEHLGGNLRKLVAAAIGAAVAEERRRVLLQVAESNCYGCSRGWPLNLNTGMHERQPGFRGTPACASLGLRRDAAAPEGGAA